MPLDHKSFRLELHVFPKAVAMPWLVKHRCGSFRQHLSGFDSFLSFSQDKSTLQLKLFHRSRFWYRNT